MNDIYEDIVSVGNNFDSLKIKLEERPDINSNLGVPSQMQPIPVPMVGFYSSSSKANLRLLKKSFQLIQ